MAGQKEHGPKKSGSFNDKSKGNKRTFSKAGGKDEKRGPSAGGKKDFKKREFKANNKRINEKEDSNTHQGLQIVRAEAPEKFKKITYGKAGAEGSLNRRQKQKVSDIIKKLRVSELSL